MNKKIVWHAAEIGSCANIDQQLRKECVQVNSKPNVWGLKSGRLSSEKNYHKYRSLKRAKLSPTSSRRVRSVAYHLLFYAIKLHIITHILISGRRQSLQSEIVGHEAFRVQMRHKVHIHNRSVCTALV